MATSSPATICQNFHSHSRSSYHNYKETYDDKTVGHTTIVSQAPLFHPRTKAT